MKRCVARHGMPAGAHGYVNAGGPTMTELARVEGDIATLQGSIKIAKLALADPSLSADDRSRWLAGIDLYEQHLCELLAVRDDPRSLAED